MYTIANNPSALNQALLQITAVLQQLVARVRTAQQEFAARWEARAHAAIAARELSSLNDRDLRDMGISRCDIPRLAQEEFERRRV